MSKKKFFYGTMNASKSAQILMQTFNFERQSKTFLIFKPAIDTRDENFVKSRAFQSTRQAWLIHSNELGTMYNFAKEFNPNFVFADEIQFFTKEQVEELAKISLELNIPIFAYGLLISYTGELFEGSKRAIECGFTLHELKMQCDFCTEKSTHHLLYINNKVVTSGEPIHVGDQEFKSTCYKCYISSTSVKNNSIKEN